MKLIAEHDSETGRFYVYRENDVTFRHNEEERSRTRAIKTLEECDNECQLDRGQYVVVDITPVRSNRKKAAR